MPSDPPPSVDVVAVGNALVDVLANADDELLLREGMTKGAMTLVDAQTAAAIFEVMGPTVQMSGGGAANTTVGVVSLGGSAAFLGRVRDDELGEVFAHDIRAAGVRFDAKPAATGSGTGRCLILVTPDAQRTMNTYLGIAAELGVDDIDESLFASAAVTFLEGFLWDPPGAREALRAAAKTARAAHRRVSFTLSDAFLVDRHRVEFLEFIADDVDVLFANRVELTSLLQDEDVASAAMSARDLCDVIAVTLSEEGSMVVSRDGVVSVPAVVIGDVVDTTGAGDLYAAGFLFGLSRGMDLAVCGHIGSLAAAEVISHVGGRPQGRLAELVADEI